MSTPSKTLVPFTFSPLPLGAIHPRGWLSDQLHVQADGLTGHLDEFWPSVSDSRWIGGTSEGWECAPYWLDGLVPLAVLLDDARLKEKAQRWVDYILLHQHEDGWFGAKDDPHNGTGESDLDPWPQFVLFKAFTQWQEATDDERIIPALLRAAHRIQMLLEEKPLRSWAKMRWADLVLSLHWLYERTEEDFLLALAETAQSQGYDWRDHFAAFRYTERTDPKWLKTLPGDDCLPIHGVNNAMGVKSGVVWGRQSGDNEDSVNSLQAVDTLDKYHGQVTGMFSGDEHLAGRNPIQGTETCTVTEYLFSLEQMLALTGELSLADRIEQIAYNALPAALTKDMWARQYDQQPNQVWCSVAPRDWISNGPHSNTFTLEGNFGCCTANLHQGWPKFVAHLWMRDGEGLVAAYYGPSTVSARVGGVPVQITEETEYPFRGEIHFTVQADAPVAFPLSLRIPAWAEGATVTVNNHAPEATQAGDFHQIERVWQSGDHVTLRLPLTLRYERRFRDAVSILRGPLVMSLRIGERFEQIGGQLPHADYAVEATTPWNYGLLLDEATETFAVRQASLSSIPFSVSSPPVIVTAAAYRLPQWVLVNDSAALPADYTPVVPGETTVENVELIPFGSTHLRISEFPVVSASVFSQTAPALDPLSGSAQTAARYVRRFAQHGGETI